MTVGTSRRRRWLWWLFAPLLLLVLLPWLSDVYYKRAVMQRHAFPFPSCKKVWAHRGYAATGGENSLQSIAEAYRRGAVGVEIDVLYDRELDDFVVSHDRPYTLFDGQPLLLESVLSLHSRSGFFWLDAKNLRSLSPLTAHRAIRRLATLIRRYQLTERAFVESSHPVYLSWLVDRGIHTSYAISPGDRRRNPPLYELHVAIMKLTYVSVGADAISMNAARYTPGTSTTFDRTPILLSTINDAILLRHLSAIPKMKVILSDEDHYAISSCSSNNGE